MQPLPNQGNTTLDKKAEYEYFKAEDSSSLVLYPMGGGIYGPPRVHRPKAQI